MAQNSNSEARNKNEIDDHQLSNEDLEQKHQLELLVGKIQDSDPTAKKYFLDSLRNKIRTLSSSMTYNPRSLVLLLPHYESLEKYYKKMEDLDLKRSLADILSVLAFTTSTEGKHESLRYYFLGSRGDIESWGEAYIRSLNREILEECRSREIPSEEKVDDDFNIDRDALRVLSEKIIIFYMKHNAEPEAVDLSTEDMIQCFITLMLFTDKSNFQRTCLYLTSTARYNPDLENKMVLSALKIYLEHRDYTNAFRMAIFLRNQRHIWQVFGLCKSLLQKKQLCCILARHVGSFVINSNMFADGDDLSSLEETSFNTRLSDIFLSFARDIDVMEPKTPQDVYKVELLDGRAATASRFESDRETLAATFVNAFINAGFCQDNFMTKPSEAEASTTEPSENWLFGQDGYGKTTATASLGLIFLWNLSPGFEQIKNYYGSEDKQVFAGALLGLGILTCRVWNVRSHELLNLYDFPVREDPVIQISAIMGLGIAYAGTCDTRLGRKLSNVLQDENVSHDVITFAAISLGLVYLSSRNGSVAKTISDVISKRTTPQEDSLSKTALSKLLDLPNYFIFLGHKDIYPSMIESSSGGKLELYGRIVQLSYCCAGTGNVLLVQQLLWCCTEHFQNIELDRGPAVLGIALVAMGEEVGLEMAIRSLKHVFYYGCPFIRRAVPLALGLLSISNPKVEIMNMLSRFSHDQDEEVAMSAVISLGLTGAGTNNGIAAEKLQKLSSYYHESPDILFCVRIAQGLVNLGKGLLTLNPYHSDRFLLSPVAIGGLMIVLHACLYMKSIILGGHHNILYFLVLAMQPRMLFTVDENCTPLSVPVRIGKAVDVAGLAGQRRNITNFKTYQTPVLLSAGERAELDSEKYTPLSPILEGVVILKEKSVDTEDVEIGSSTDSDDEYVYVDGLESKDYVDGLESKDDDIFEDTN